ncbi:protein-glutamine gamma-glutamyltransferase K-like [Sinocyclocheilus rhinocerous]|uniref:protein-glutamine gamma-glutamyltransferase K-like n=1 Tax=Sinocyclocheilus rhinocerous TaxID=307959 RepID=UPI0007B83F4C|nr:PREDICTED: protein-glutamine gamma-glutamyltransferase K-like [Sinocyclocheilus rhinocerous]
MVMYYTGVLKATLKKNWIPLDLKLQKTKSLRWTLQYKEYMNYPVDQGAPNQTKQILATQFNLRLHTPDLIITVHQ